MISHEEGPLQGNDFPYSSIEDHIFSQDKGWNDLEDPYILGQSLDADLVTPKQEFESPGSTGHTEQTLGAISSLIENEVKHSSPEEHEICFGPSSTEPTEFWDRAAYIGENVPHLSTNSTPEPICKKLEHEIEGSFHLGYFPDMNVGDQSTKPYTFPDIYLRSTPMATLNNTLEHTSHALDMPANFDQAAFIGTKNRKYGDDNNESSELADSEIPSMKALVDYYLNSKDVSTYYASYEEAMEARRGDYTLQVDTTLPTTRSEMQSIVLALCDAMTSTAYAKDNDNMIQPFRNSKIPMERIEAACWRIVEACVQRHTYGPLRADDEIKTKTSCEIKCFSDRMERIFECLVKQKTICKHLLDPPYLYMLVDDPVGARKRVAANKVLNKRKGEFMNAGKQMLAMRAGTDDPFVVNPGSFATPHHTRGNRKLESIESEREALPTPDTTDRRTALPIGLGTDSELGPHTSVEDSTTNDLRNIIASQSSFTPVSDFNVHPSDSHDVSPTLGSLARANLDGAGFLGDHSAHLLAQNVGDFASRLRAARAQHYHIPGTRLHHHLASQAPSRRVGGPTSHPRQGAPITILSTPTPGEQFKACSTTVSRRRKRAGSDSEDSAYHHSAKKSRTGA